MLIIDCHGLFEASQWRAKRARRASTGIYMHVFASRSRQRLRHDVCIGVLGVSHRRRGGEQRRLRCAIQGEGVCPIEITGKNNEKQVYYVRSVKDGDAYRLLMTNKRKWECILSLFVFCFSSKKWKIAKKCYQMPEKTFFGSIFYI